MTPLGLALAFALAGSMLSFLGAKYLRPWFEANQDSGQAKFWGYVTVGAAGALGGGLGISLYRALNVDSELIRIFAAFAMTVSVFIVPAYLTRTAQ